MQAVQILCITSLCCFKIVQASCKDERSRRISMPVYFFLCLAIIGGLVWGTGFVSDLKQQNLALIPDAQPCTNICGNDYAPFQASPNICCIDGSNCQTKTQCQEDWDDFYLNVIISCYIIMGCAALYQLFFFGYMIAKCIRMIRIRGRLIQHDPLLVVGPALDGGLLNASESERRLRNSQIVRDSNMCSICLEPFNYDKAIKLQCGHIYHSECIRTWVSQHDTCPLCRNII